ncbi:MAG: FecR family protein [Chitinophagaceae bacterium]|nr:FecR family protein [Chitinophagaceae bacterium]
MFQVSVPVYDTIMPNPTSRLDYLLNRYITGQYTPAEWVEFWDELSKTDASHPVFRQMQEWWNNQEGQNELSANVDAQGILKKIMMSDQPAPVVAKRKRLFIAEVKYAAAIFVLVCAAAFFLFRPGDKSLEPPVGTTKPAMKAEPIGPGKNKAILTLSNGKQVALDDAQKTVISDAGVQIEKVAGQLIYGKTDIVALNTMTTPKGGQFSIVLPDGTKAWLNAASSITYPTMFTNNERRVSVTGEVYFEVVKNAALPFRVKLPDNSEIQVLGTHFNVNSYTDEPSSKTTLVEGSVKINNSILQPGEAYTNGKIVKANTEEAVAWRNGLFIFDKTDLQSVMRQLVRWYDVEVKYEGPLRVRTFSGKIGRDLSLEDLLDGLKRTDVHFRIEGKTIIVVS